MLSHWAIKLLHVVFVFSLGTVALWLFYNSLTSDKARRSSPKQRAELLLRVIRDGAPFLKMPLGKGHYLIGRGPECDIPLKGLGIPLVAGEMSFQSGEYFFKNCHNTSIAINNEPIASGARKILPGDRIMLYNYTIEIEGKGHNESIGPDRYRQEERE